MKKRTFFKSGYTLMELLVVIALFALLLSAFYLVNWQRQIERGHDAKRKDDLHDIQIALEHYQNDHGCYPDVGLMANCGSSNNIFASYNMPGLVCDPNGDAYLYQLVDSSDPCKGYRLYTHLKDNGDLDIKRIGCDGPNGCNTGDPKFNFGVSAGATVAQ